MLVSTYALSAQAVMAPVPNEDTTSLQTYLSGPYYVGVSTPKAQIASYSLFSCVSYAKYRRPDQVFSWGTPGAVQVYDISPFVGSLVITREGPWGHVGYVEKVAEDSIYISETNYEPGRLTYRWIRRDDPLIRGYR